MLLDSWRNGERVNDEGYTPAHPNLGVHNLSSNAPLPRRATRIVRNDDAGRTLRTGFSRALGGGHIAG